MSLLNVYYITLCRLCEFLKILSEVKITSVLFKSGYTCNGLLYCILTYVVFLKSKKSQIFGSYTLNSLLFGVIGVVLGRVPLNLV